jgi:hypothetical protein
MADNTRGNIVTAGNILTDFRRNHTGYGNIRLIINFDKPFEDSQAGQVRILSKFPF